MAEPELPAALRVGGRIIDKEGYRGVVRYLGPVVTSKSAAVVYAGVEWDDPLRGRNDGSVTTADGSVVRYFACDAGRGSFVKASLLDAGVEIVEALNGKYMDSSVAGAGTVASASGRDIEVVFAGEDKLRAKQQLHRLVNVSVKSCRVSTVAEGAILAAAPKIRELDASDNLLSDWGDLARLGTQLPQLRLLDLGANRLARPVGPSIPALLGTTLHNLRVLVLNETGLKWSDVCALEPALPNLEELHFCGNNLTSLSPLATATSGAPASAPASSAASEDTTSTSSDAASSSASSSSTAAPGADVFVTGFPNLTVLSLNDNLLERWEEVWRLRWLPRLQRLVLNNNRLTELAYAPSLDSAPRVPLQPPTIDANTFAVAAATVLARVQGELGFRGAGIREAATAGDAPAAEGGAGGPPASSSSSSSSSTSSSTSSSASPATSATAHLPFGSLEALSISDNELHSWASIDALNAFPALRWLRLQNNRHGVASDVGPSRARQEIVARVCTLTVLNGSDVRPREREDAEKAYVRWAAQQIADDEGFPGVVEFLGEDPIRVADRVARAARATEPDEFARSPTGLDLMRGVAAVAVEGGSGDAAATATAAAASSAAGVGSESAGPSERTRAAVAKLLRLHPRYFSLVIKHGEHVAVASAGSGSGAGSLAKSVVAVTIRSMAGNSCMMDPIARKLPLTMTILQVKQLAARAFKMEIAFERLSFRDSSNAYPTVLDDDLKTLAYYAVTDGSEILIEEVDPREADREEAERRAEQERRVRDQEKATEHMRRLQLHQQEEARDSASRAASGGAGHP